MSNKLIIKNEEGEDIFLSSVRIEDVVDRDGITLQQKLDSINEVVPEFSEGVTIATVGGKAIKVPETLMGKQIITGVTFFNKTQDIIDSTDNFIDGQVLETRGFYLVNDGGGNKYLVKTTVTGEDDGATLIHLKNGLWAEVIPPSNGVFNFRQFGAKTFSLDTTFDCKNSLLKYINYNHRKEEDFKLYIPGGPWQFSQTDLSSQSGFFIYGENINSSLLPGKTVILPISGGSQSYIWKISGNNITINNLSFTRSNNFGGAKQMGEITSTNAYTSATCTTAVIFDGVTNGYFDGLYFSFCSNCFDVVNTTNTYFGYLNLRQSGGSVGGVRSAVRIGDNVSGVYFDYFNAEVINGNVFYGYGIDNSSPTQFIINDFQMEGTHATSGGSSTDPGYQHSGITHWFVFNGKLGSKDAPCILNSVSISNLCSYNTISGVTYKSMALFGHEDSTKSMGFIVGNAFVSFVDGSGPWYVYDTQPNAYFCFNQPISSTTKGFYLVNASAPLINTFNKRVNLIQGYQFSNKVSYKSGAYSSHSLVGSGNEYNLYAFPNKSFQIRFYNSGGTTTSFKVNISRYDENSGTWVLIETNKSISCNSSVGWQTTTISLDLNIPFLLKITGIPDYIWIDYFMEYENS